jgi:hypothetical protein
MVPGFLEILENSMMLEILIIVLRVCGCLFSDDAIMIGVPLVE